MAVSCDICSTTQRSLSYLALSTQAQRAEAFRKQRESSLSSPAGPRSVSSSSSAFPDTLPAGTEYGADNGIRLEAVWLTHDPAYPDEQPTAPLARYTYTRTSALSLLSLP